MKKVLFYHLLCVFAISLLLIPSYQWILSGKEIPKRTQVKYEPTQTLIELSSFVLENKQISMVYNKYSGIHFTESGSSFVSSLKPYCIEDESYCLYADEDSKVLIMDQNETISPWKIIDTQINGLNKQVSIYLLDASKEYKISPNGFTNPYEITCLDTSFCRKDSTPSIDEIKNMAAQWQKLEFSKIKPVRNQFTHKLHISENWEPYYPKTGSTSYRSMSIRHYKVEENINYLWIDTGGSNYYQLTDEQLNEFILFLQSE